MVSLRHIFSPKAMLQDHVKDYVEKTQKGNQNLKPMRNPFFEEVPVIKHKKPTGKFKTVKRNPNFQHINEHDRKILKKFRRLAWTFDNGLGVKRFRIGWCTIIGLFIPVGGDVIDALLMCMLIHYAGKVSGGKKAKDVQKMRKKMIRNLAIAICIGLVPGAGAIVDNFFRCNTRNAALLEDLLEQRELKKAVRPSELAQEGKSSSRGNKPLNLPYRRRGTENNAAIELRNISPQRDDIADRQTGKAYSTENRREQVSERPKKPGVGGSTNPVNRSVRKREPKTPQGFF